MQILSIEDIVRATNGEVVNGKSDGIIKAITTDSRKAENDVLFIPLKGEKVDGHNFINSALEKGAVVLTQYDADFFDGTVVKVKDTRIALGDIARYYLEKYRVPVVSVTGSVGKTTTKDLIYSVLSQKFKTHKTPNNFNNDIGLPLTVFGIEKEHNAAVIEMGMSHFGEISYLASIAKPDCAVITNIGMSHIENLGSREGIFKAKMEIVENFNESNTLFVNCDSPFLNSLSDTRYRLVKFGINENADVYAKDIENLGLSGTRFTVVHQNGEFKATVKQPGVHNIYNALSAVCVGLYMGLTEKQCAEGLENCEYTSGRLEIINHNGMEIISDCYNSSPDSIRAALKVMGESLKDRKVAVLGDVLEMGEYAKDEHYNVGKDIPSMDVDMLITAGENAKYIADGARAMGMENIVSFDTTDELRKEINNLLKAGDCVLIKASHGMRFIEITEEITGRKDT